MPNNNLLLLPSQNPLIVLGISIVALFLGPMIHRILKNNKNFLKIVDGFTLVVVVELALVHLIPHAIEHSGWLAMGMALLGLMLPSWLEKRLHSTMAKKAHILALLLAMLGLCLHSFTDGMALVLPQLSDSGKNSFLPLAVILHRFPVGLSIWWLLRPAYGSIKALMMLTAMSLITAAGFFSGGHLVPVLDHSAIGLFEALVAGSLMHVIFHRHEQLFNDSKQNQWSSGLGALLGVLLIYLINAGPFNLSDGHHHIGHTATLFMNLAAQSAPALIFAYLASGLIQAFLPSSSVRWMSGGSHFTQSFKGMGFGLPLPICSCGVVPVYQTLVKQGVPLSAAMAFFVATPELGLDALLISLPLLGGKFTLLRLVGAAIVALLVGWIIGKNFKNQNQIADEEKQEPKRPLKVRLKEGLKVGFVDVVDHTAPWILFGLAIAALAHPFLETNNLLKDIPWWLEVPFFALIGMPVYVCATGITPFVAILLFNGVSPGAGLAFLLTGPATNVTTFGILSQLHGKKLALSFALIVASLAIGLGYLVNMLWPEGFATPPIEQGHNHGSLWQQISLGLLALIYLASLFRSGPRYLINQILAFESKHSHDHDHSHDQEEQNCCHS